GWVINIFQRGTASMGRIHNVLTEQVEVMDAVVGDKADVPVEVRGDIEFRNLHFRYGNTIRAAERGNGRAHGDEEVLKKVNLRVPAGTSLAIVGPTGSGKSTLVSLIPRIYDAEPGSVLIDGRPIRELPLAVLRRGIGFVPQETFLFSDTIRENIAFGAETASLDDVRRAAEAANIASDIEGFPDGYNTVVG